MQVINKKTGKDATLQAIKIIEESLIKSGYIIAKSKSVIELGEFIDKLGKKNGRTKY